MKKNYPVIAAIDRDREMFRIDLEHWCQRTLAIAGKLGLFMVLS